MKNIRFGTIFTAYCIAAVILFFYSYTQVDLNLTLSSRSIWQAIQKLFQHIGYFERTVSTSIYIGILTVFFLLYLVSVSRITAQQISRYQLWKIILTVSLLLVFTYPAFSYDMFNYMFTAKTVALYHKNPYMVIPLDFSGVDPWITFMRWTHLPSAYTPIWILMTVPAYLLGFGYFLTVLWNIKIVIMICYLITVWCIEKILLRVDSKHALVGTAIFALNPLIIIETMVSGHNDIVMMAFSVSALLAYIYQKNLTSFFLLSLSVSSKLMTLFMTPAYFFRFNRQILLAFMVAGLMLVLLQRDVLPWYFVWIMPWIALLPRSRRVFLLSVSVSLGLLLGYGPFLYYGNWDNPVPLFKDVLLVTPIAATVVLMIFHPKFSHT